MKPVTGIIISHPWVTFVVNGWMVIIEIQGENYFCSATGTLTIPFASGCWYPCSRLFAGQFMIKLIIVFSPSSSPGAGARAQGSDHPALPYELPASTLWATCHHPLSYLWAPYELPITTLWSTYELPVSTLLATCDHPLSYLSPPYELPMSYLSAPFELPVTTLWATCQHPMSYLWATC